MHIVKGNLSNVLIVKFFGTFGSEMLSFAIGLFVLQRTGSALSMGISLITGPIIGVFITPVVGYVVDTFSHKAVMIFSQIGTIGSLLCFTLFFFIYPRYFFIELVLLIAILSVTDNFLTTAIQASLTRLFDKSDLQKANSLNQSISSLAELLAPILGAVVYTLVSLSMFVYIEIGFEAMALFAISSLSFSVTAMEAVDEIPQHNSIISNFLGGIKFLWNNKLFLILSGSSGVINFFFATINIGLPFLLVDQLKLSNTQYGFSQSAISGGMFLGGLILSRIHFKIHPLKVAYTSLAIFSVVIALLGLPTLLSLSKISFTVIFVIIGCSLGLLLVLSNTPVDVYMQQNIPEGMQGRIFTLDETLSTVLMPLGTVIFGILYDKFSTLLIFTIGGVLMLIPTLIVLSIIQDQRV